MNRFTILLAAAFTTVVPAAIAATVTVESLIYESGFVTTMDATKGSVVINGKAFAAKPADLYNVQPGVEIEIWFDNQNQAAAVNVKPAETQGDLIS